MISGASRKLWSIIVGHIERNRLNVNGNPMLAGNISSRRAEEIVETWR